MIWVGLELHQRYITACALDAAVLGPQVASQHIEFLATSSWPRGEP